MPAAFPSRAEFDRRCLWPLAYSPHVYDPARGYVVWRPGTGGGVELLHLRAVVPGRGHGRSLVRTLVERLAADPPGRVVFGFALPAAAGFYGKMGFALTPLAGVYRDGPAVFFRAPLGALRDTLWG